ncbi:hypothetical protein HPB50_011589 [Hyalomma asiaticum]|uniref:Uncharacterized protein n=1 Tax=Hyalomma asiaticum TaxID=266040 RepID=A0ACB7TEX7_HYAAI|nr:hypothetical protein HPB50_011589 [Hyalomma asiaticum]
MSHSEYQDVLGGNRWQEQLDLDGPRGAASDDDTCWLCDDFTAWSPVMVAINLELYGTRRRRLGLRFLERWTELNKHLASIARHASCLASRLLCHHALGANDWQEQLDLDRPRGAASDDDTCWLCDDFTAWSPVMVAIDLELLTLQNIRECCRARLHLRHLDAIVGLEIPILCSDGVGSYPEAEVDVLLEHNRSNLISTASMMPFFRFTLQWPTLSQRCILCDSAVGARHRRIARSNAVTSADWVSKGSGFGSNAVNNGFVVEM